MLNNWEGILIARFWPWTEKDGRLAVKWDGLKGPMKHEKKKKKKNFGQKTI